MTMETFLNVARFLGSSFLAAAFSATAVAAPPTLSVNFFGTLTGATGVSVNGAMYDVEFMDGSCNSLFSDCSSFVFNTSSSAEAASHALVDTVFSRGFANGSSLIGGCFDAACHVFTPFGPGGTYTVVHSASLYATFPPEVRLDSRIINTGQTANMSYITWAVWSASPVPEAGTMPLAVLGGIVLVAVQRCRRRIDSFAVSSLPFAKKIRP
jgi:hypothetical protein